MSWPCFLNLLHLIKPDTIFYNQSQSPQQGVSIKLAIATCFLGYNGSGAAVLRLKNIFQVGYGTINLYTTQFIKEIYNMQSQLVIQEEGFPGCIGFVDDTKIPLSQNPPIDGNHSYYHKKRSDTQFNSPLFVMSTRNSHPIKPVIQDHATIAMYSQTCRLLSILK
ncbi:uncharacterized protein VP01_12149g1, partial [Puccinia sorghi]